MTDIFEQVRRIEKQVDLPNKPQLGTVSGWILCLFLLGAAVAILCFLPDEKVLWLIMLLIALVLLVLGIINLASMIYDYVMLRREFRLAKTDEQKYRQKKALEFVERNRRNKEMDEMLVEYRKKRPSRKLPRYVEEAIYYGNSLLIQEYLETVQEEMSARLDA